MELIDFHSNFRINNLNQTIESEDIRYEIQESDTFMVLKIKNISLFDRGYYTLRARNDFGEIESLQLFLNVTDKPQVNVESSRFNLINYPSHLTCAVYAYPEAMVQWFFKPCEDDSCEYNEVSRLTKLIVPSYKCFCRKLKTAVQGMM